MLCVNFAIFPCNIVNLVFIKTLSKIILSSEITHEFCSCKFIYVAFSHCFETICKKMNK